MYNHNFIYFSNQTIKDYKLDYHHPDGWIFESLSSDSKITLYDDRNCRIFIGDDNPKMKFSQVINEFPRWIELLIGKRVTACAVVSLGNSVECNLTFSLDTGKRKSSKSVLLKSIEPTEILIDIDVNQDVEQLILSIESNSNKAILDIHKVYANIGNIALDTLPCIVEGIIGERKQYISTAFPPVSELSLCEVSKELSSSHSRLDSFLNGKFGRGTNGRSLLPDMRGYFSRAWNNEALVDTDAANRTPLGEGTVKGDNVGTVEEDQFKEHVHQLSFNGNAMISEGTAAPVASINKKQSNTDKTGGTETRGKNIAELYTIKWA